MLPSCEICQIIESGKILANGSRCCVVCLKSEIIVAALKYHSDRSLFLELYEAYVLLDVFKTPDSITLEYLGDEGHWGIYFMEFKK